MKNEQETSTKEEKMISRKELRIAILEIEHDLLMTILGKNDKSDNQDTFPDEGLLFGMSMIAVFADRLLEEFPEAR